MEILYSEKLKAELPIVKINHEIQLNSIVSMRTPNNKEINAPDLC